MAFDWPSTVPTPSNYTIQPREQVVGDASPFTGAREIMHRWHQWQAIINWNHLANDDYLNLIGHLSSSRGGIVIFKVPIFSYRDSRGTKTGSVTLSGSHAGGATSLTITGGSGTLSRGDWIEIDQGTGNPRAYIVTITETAGVVGINPGLRAPKAGGAAVRHFGSGTLYDTMELVGDSTFGSAMPSPLPGIFQPFTLEFLTALRRNL